MNDTKNRWWIWVIVWTAIISGVIYLGWKTFNYEPAFPPSGPTATPPPVSNLTPEEERMRVYCEKPREDGKPMCEKDGLTPIIYPDSL